MEEKKSYAENTASVGTGEWRAHWGPFLNLRKGGDCSLINTSLPLEMSHTECEKLSVCPG